MLHGSAWAFPGAAFYFASVAVTLSGGSNGETITCTSQSANLLLGFAKSPNSFLSMAEIAALCHWSSDELGVKERRRTAISTLKKLLEVDKSIRIESVRGKDYQIVLNS